MKIRLPTQFSPIKPVYIANLTISPYKRVAFPHPLVPFSPINGQIYKDCFSIESTDNNLQTLNKLIVFHSFIFDDFYSLYWYERIGDLPDNLTTTDVCAYPRDYSEISSLVYFPKICPVKLNYNNLFEIFLGLNDDDVGLVKNYFNSYDFDGDVKANSRQITNSTFWKIVMIFSVVDSIIGDQKFCVCIGPVECNFSRKEVLHKQLSEKDWINARLSKIISDPNVLEEYLAVIWKVRQGIRHKTVHQSILPSSQYITQEDYEVVYDWERVKDNWKDDSTALLSLKLGISEIARYLLLNKLFGINFFPSLKPLHSVRIQSA